MEIAWRHQVVQIQKHTSFSQCHPTISWSQTSHNLNENLKQYRTLSRRFRCSAIEFRFSLSLKLTSWKQKLSPSPTEHLYVHLSLVSILDITPTLLSPPALPSINIALQIHCVIICNTNICNITIYSFPHPPCPP